MTGEEGGKGVDQGLVRAETTNNGQSSTTPTSSDLDVLKKDKNSNNIGDRESDSENNSLRGAKDKDGQRDVSNCAKINNDQQGGIKILNLQELEVLSKQELCDAYQEVARYLERIKRENTGLKESEDKLRGQQIEATRRENVLVMRLTTKEQEMQEYIAQLNELKQSIAPTTSALRNALIDPAVNVFIQKMKRELSDTKKKLEDTQNDLNAWKFTPDSNTGKRLMAKCRMLYQENEDLGKMITSGRLAKLESDLALQRSLTDEMKKSQSELDDLVQELDEDVEGMQSTICYLQRELMKAKATNTLTNSNADSLPQNEDFNNEVVKLRVRITDLCAQCQVTHKNKESSSEIPVKMEVVEDERTTSENENDRSCLNGESSSSSQSDTDPFIPSSERVEDDNRTIRTSVANTNNDYNTLTNASDNSSASQPKHNYEDGNENENERTKGGDYSDTTPPPPKKSKPTDTFNATENSLASLDEPFCVSQNGSMDHN